MDIKSILVPFLDEHTAKLAFDAAALMAKENKSHISCVHIKQRPVPTTTVVYPLGGVFTKFSEEFQETENKLAADLQQLFDALTAQHNISVAALTEHTNDKGVTASWRDQEGDVFAIMTQQATACDIAILAAIGDDVSPVAKLLAEELLFQSGRPLLLCPPAGLKTVPKKIVVAWNGRQEAARAVGAALGLLRTADAVKVLTVRKTESPLVNTDDLTAYLRLHDIEATSTEIELTEGENETDRLDEEVREFNADLLIMGAYSHNRWREAILGGFTRHILKDSSIPVFITQ